MTGINYQIICKELLSNLPLRQKQVLSRRFGLGQNQIETLQKIGNDLGVTRERVRQLEKSGFLRLKDFKDNKNLKKILDYFENFLNENGGLKREDIFLNEVASQDDKNCVSFLLFLADNVYRLGDDEELFPFWAVQKDKDGIVKEVVKRVKDFFNKEKKSAQLEDLSKALLLEDKNFLKACLEISKDIEQGPLKNYGLSVWPEIKPRGVRDVAYLVLQKDGQPLHFKLIAQKAGELQGEIFSKRKMLPQTIHNELIRDKRFVLVGRGIYGLSDWGYSTGTVKDVIYKVLQANAPMKKEEILLAVQKQRIVKPNTVLLNLSDKNLFAKDQTGKYFLKTKIA